MENLDNFEARYPIGMQSFESIRIQNKVYVDKTAFIYRLATVGSHYFLSRPRRFGKSLLLSTFKCYFQGKKEQFNGLAIENLEEKWTKHPVIHLSMGGKNFDSVEDLKDHLNNILFHIELELGVQKDSDKPEIRFGNLIRNAYHKYGQKVVILIDEYDKPMLDTRSNNDQSHHNIRALLRGFYGCIKEVDEFIRFSFITGITKFSHVNIFSGLNNLRDISLEPRYNAICGITETEMGNYFNADIMHFAECNKMTTEEAALEFKIHYDGYRFASEGENIYNPFSVLSALSAMRFSNYWFKTGTSFFLVEEMKRSTYNFQGLNSVVATEDELLGTNESTKNIIALLYQAGYLTIKGYKPEAGLYTLGFPNKEVSSGFFNNLLQVLVHDKTDSNFSAAKVLACATDGNPDEMMSLFKIALAQYNYDQIDTQNSEKHFNLLMYTISQAIGLAVESEIRTPSGRIDMTILTRNYIYIIEFKVNSYPRRALMQINKNNYADKYYGDTRTIFKIGANFSTKTRNLTGWLIEKD